MEPNAPRGNERLDATPARSGAARSEYSQRARAEGPGLTSTSLPAKLPAIQPPRTHISANPGGQKTQVSGQTRLPRP